jgi:gamma-D-glutamyl-L-lysine dipeptidyl-peptidase
VARHAVRVALAPLLARPKSASTQISQLLGGHAVDVLRSDGEWLYVTGADGYGGWVHGGYLGARVHAGNGTPRSGWRTAGALSLGCTARTSSGAYHRLPLGAHLPRGGTVETGEALRLESRRVTFPATARAILSSADRFFAGTPYVWGGVTPWGADCSGFVQSIFGLHGVHLARDAWQQASMGSEIRDREAIEPGDLVFFCTQGATRITHVAIAAESNVIVHLSVSRGGYAVDRLSGGGDSVTRYLEGSYCFARRVL